MCLNCEQQDENEREEKGALPTWGRVTKTRLLSRSNTRNDRFAPRTPKTNIHLSLDLIKFWVTSRPDPQCSLIAFNQNLVHRFSDEVGLQSSTNTNVLSMQIKSPEISVTGVFCKLCFEAYYKVKKNTLGHKLQVPNKQTSSLEVNKRL